MWINLAICIISQIVIFVCGMIIGYKHGYLLGCYETKQLLDTVIKQEIEKYKNDESST